MAMESYRCVVCQEEITAKEHSYSTRFFNMALCRKHQEIQKMAKARQAEVEQKPSPTTIETKNTASVEAKVLEGAPMLPEEK